jgi:hypothetical protein
MGMEIPKVTSAAGDSELTAILKAMYGAGAKLVRL